jgi:cardiolipin synthase C
MMTTSRERILISFVSIVLLSACGTRGAIKELTEPDGQLFVKQNLCKADSKLKEGLSLPDLLEQVRASHPKEETGIHLLEDGGGALAARGWLTRKALRSIDIQYFIFSSDQVGLIALQELINAAQRGVKVRLLVDDLLHHGDAQLLLAADTIHNLEIRIYNPTINIGRSLPNKLVKVATDFRAVNQRMHNKTFIVDDEIVITGGRNVADEYFDFSLEYNFRDRDLLLIQGAASQVKRSFDTFWDHRLSVKLSNLLEEQDTTLTTRVLRQLKHLSCDPHRFWPEVQQRIANIPVRFLELREQGHLTWVKEVEFVSDLPGKNDGKQGLGGGGLSTDALIKLVDEAKESIYIQTPYFVTTDLGKGLFKRAVDRGVKVKILTNSLSTTDSFPAFASYRSDRDALVKLGIEVYESKPHNEAWSKMMTSELTQRLRSLAMLPMIGLHAKSMVIDGQIIMVGTFNLDPRSANLNTECIVIAHDQAQATRLQETMIKEINHHNAWRIRLGSDPDHHASFSNRWYAFWSWLVPKEII